jgi:hypothetical protein
MFSSAVDEKLSPQEFIDKMRDQKRLVRREELCFGSTGWGVGRSFFLVRECGGGKSFVTVAFRTLIPPQVMGIGHRIKSLENPDKRVEILKDFVKAEFPKHHVLDFAMEVRGGNTGGGGGR